MNVFEAVERISRALAILTYQVKAENAAGLFSKNALIEDLLLPVLKIVLKAPRLRNLNEGQLNFPGIDLGDSIAKIAVQVTTDASATKITESCSGFVKHKHYRKYKRLVVFVLTESLPSYGTPSRRKWRTLSRQRFSFSPTSDILCATTLLTLVRALPAAKKFEIERILAHSVFGEEFVNVTAQLSTQVRRQLDFERKSGKYIPQVFVETRSTKDLARAFAHPVLFLPRTVEAIGRINIPGFSRVLGKCGLPPLPPLTKNAGRLHSPDGAPEAVDRIFGELALLRSAVAPYEALRYKDPPPLPIPAARRPFFDANTFTLQEFGLGLKWRLKDVDHALRAVRSRVFILTGKAGQGKTNFVCDFVEKFLIPHQIPSAYLSGRALSGFSTSDLGDTIQKLVLDGKTASFSKAAELLSDHARDARKPFVLVIDGLNEHHRLSEFALQLHQFIGTFLQYPNLRLLLTCRSEFFRQRFGALVSDPVIAEQTLLWEANEQKLDDESFDRMVDGYFEFFGVTEARVSERVTHLLRKDVLLLRFFCEAYGSKGKGPDYVQPTIRGIYRDQIFEIYLSRKLDTAHSFFARLTDQVAPVSPKAELWSVLEQLLQHMLSTWTFGNVPASVVSKELQPAFYSLLDEELILRRDMPPDDRPFPSATETINFTFDEFRDFLLAQFLLRRVYSSADRSAFESCVSRGAPEEHQVVEGIKRFLFYASRQPANSEFWEYYKTTAWYSDVYDDEVFKIDGELHTPLDEEAAVASLRTGGDRGRNVARSLALNWHREFSPVLNLGLLLGHITQSTDHAFDDLIAKTFRTVDYGQHQGANASAFAEFVVEKIFPTFSTAPDALNQWIVRFMIVLLPVDANANMNSKVDEAFRQLITSQKTYTVGLLEESLDWTLTRHLPYVWRLLSLPDGPASAALLQRAEATQHAADGVDPILHRETTRFIERRRL